jgi:hypothetical protein
MGDEQDQDPYASIDSGVERQRVILEGWVASLADGGNPGPHVSMRPGGAAHIVVHAGRIAELIAELARVRDRIVETWDDLPASEKSELEERAMDAPRNRARIDQDRSLFYDRLAERLGAVAAAMSSAPLSPKAAVSALADELGLEEPQVLPFATQVDLLALAGRRPST